jgi:tetrahydromethanopterin S-methyltransferase subunit B
METKYVERQEMPVLRVKADMKGKGPSAAFNLLESKLPTLKGRKFYGTFQFTPEGEEYFACVVRIDSDDPVKMQLETGVLLGGWYVSSKLMDWEKKVAQLPSLFDEMARTYDVDPKRPSLEFYRSRAELHLFLPVQGNPPQEAT